MGYVLEHIIGIFFSLFDHAESANEQWAAEGRVEQAQIFKSVQNGDFHRKNIIVRTATKHQISHRGKSDVWRARRSRVP